MKKFGLFLGGFLLGSYVMYNGLFHRVAMAAFKEEKDEEKSDDKEEKTEE